MRIYVVLALLVLALLACRKSTPCDLDPSVCVGTGTPAIIMQIVADTPTPSPTAALSTPGPTRMRVPTATVTPPAAAGEPRGLP